MYSKNCMYLFCEFVICINYFGKISIKSSDSYQSL